MSELIQVDKQQITFEELCPKWSEQVRLGEGSRLMAGLSSIHSSCIVGEAWNFSAYYSTSGGCSECKELSGELVRAPPLNFSYDIVKPPAIAIDYKNHTIRSIDHERYEFFKNRFMKHWNEAHNVK